MVTDFYHLIQEGLKEKLGSVLFQFPPRFSYTSEHLSRILESVDPTFENVVEFRHISWWNKEAIAQLGKKKIAFCGMSHPDFPADIISNANNLYYRMPGQQQLYTSGYTHQELKDLISKIQLLKHIKHSYIYFNNDISGFAPDNAQSMIAQTTPTSL